MLDQRFLELLRAKKDVVLDRSFWAKEDREKCYALCRREGVAAWKLVYLRARKDFLGRRIQERRKKGVNADSALEISEELLEQYWDGFQAPGKDEEPEIIDVEGSNDTKDGK